jgi:hypothetical protein
MKKTNKTSTRTTMNNLQLGKMYLVKEYFWFLFPKKELAVDTRYAGAVMGLAAYQDAKELSEHYKCNVFVVEPNTCFVLLEVDDGYFKLLDCNGNIGWIFSWDISGYFKLVKE